MLHGKQGLPLSSRDLRRVEAAYPNVWQFLMDTRSGAYTKGLGELADELHSTTVEYPHLLMTLEEFIQYFTAFSECGVFGGTAEDISASYVSYAKRSVETWWSQQYRRLRMSGLSPYLASVFAESDTLYVPRWGLVEYNAWDRSVYRHDAMLDNLCIATQDEGESARAAGHYQSRNMIPVGYYPYMDTYCKILGPAGLKLGDLRDQGGEGTQWVTPLFERIPLYAWIISLPENVLRAVYNVIPPKDYSPISLPLELTNYVSQFAMDLEKPPYVVEGVR